MFYTNPPQHEPSLRRSHEHVAKMLDLIEALCARAASGAGHNDSLAPSCDGYQAFIDLYELSRVEEGPILCDEEEVAYEAAFRKLGITPGQLASATGVLKRSVHAAVVALGDRVEKAAWNSRQNHHPAYSCNDVDQIIRLWNGTVKPGLLEKGPSFSSDQTYEWLKQEYEQAASLAPALATPLTTPHGVLLPDEVDLCDRLMHALREFDKASQQRGHEHTAEFDNAYRDLQAAIVDISDLSRLWEIPAPALAELGGNPFPDVYHERIQQAFVEGAALRREALRRRPRFSFGAAPPHAPPEANSQDGKTRAPAGDAAAQSHPLKLGPGLEISRGGKLVAISRNDFKLLQVLNAAPGHAVAIEDVMNKKPGAVWAEIYSGLGTSKRDTQRGTIGTALRRLRDKLDPIFVEVQLEGDEIIMRFRPGFTPNPPKT